MEDESEIWTPLKKLPSPSPPDHGAELPLKGGERAWGHRPSWSQSSSFSYSSPPRSPGFSPMHSGYHGSRRSLSFPTSEKGEFSSEKTERTTEMRITPTKPSHSSSGYHPSMYHSSRYDHSATPPAFRRPLFHSATLHTFSPSTPSSASPWHYPPTPDPNPEKVSSYFSSPSPSFGFSPRYSASPYPLSTTNSPFSFGLPPATEIKEKEGMWLPKSYNSEPCREDVRISPESETKSPADRLAEPRVTPQRTSPFPRSSNRNAKSNKPKPRNHNSNNNNNLQPRSVNKKPAKKCLNLENKKYPQLLNGKQKLRYEDMDEDMEDDGEDVGDGEEDDGKEEWKESGAQGPPPKRLTPAERLQARQRQIDLGKNTEGYKHYLELCPKHQRKKWHPRTPDKTKACSKRSWDGMVRKWRRMLHRFDPAAN